MEKLMKLRKAAAALFAMGLIGGVGSAQAGILVQNWQIDLGAIGNVATDDFTGFGVFGRTASGSVGIDEMSFDALYHQKTVKGVGNVLPIPQPGDVGTVDTLGQISQAKNSDGTVNRTTSVPSKFLNVDFELTFVSTTTSVVTSLPGPDGTQTNRHLGAETGAVGLAMKETGGLTPGVFVPANGYLNIYADVIDGSVADKTGSAANTSQFTGGAGIQDGLLIAVFKVLPSATNSGSFNNNPDALDGQDDATFELVWQYTAGGQGVIQDEFGVELALGRTLGLTDSNIDGDPDGNQLFDTAPTGWPGGPLGACPGAGTPFDNCGTENGSFVLQTVPEPGTIGLLSLALLGLGAAAKRRRV
jgi:hypothetical protein